MLAACTFLARLLLTPLNTRHRRFSALAFIDLTTDHPFDTTEAAHFGF